MYSFFLKQCKWKDVGLPGIVRWNTSYAFENNSMEKIKLFGNNMIERKYICMSNFGGTMLWEHVKYSRKMRRKRLSTLAHNSLEIMSLFSEYCDGWDVGKVFSERYQLFKSINNILYVYTIHILCQRGIYYVYYIEKGSSTLTSNMLECPIFQWLFFVLNIVDISLFECRFWSQY